MIYKLKYEATNSLDLMAAYWCCRQAIANDRATC